MHFLINVALTPVKCHTVASLFRLGRGCGLRGGLLRRRISLQPFTSLDGVCVYLSNLVGISPRKTTLLES